MERYHVAKLVQLAGTFHSRKRLQKVAYLLQAAGCPIDVKYTLHLYGPYSQDVASITDELTKASLLNERAQEGQFGTSYSYTLTEQASNSLKEFEQTERGKSLAAALRTHEEIAQKLIKEDLGVLELASTIVYYVKEQNSSFSAAVESTRNFKPELAANQHLLQKASDLANSFVDKMRANQHVDEDI